MSTQPAGIAAHYGGEGVFERILDALATRGVARDAITAEHLKAVDEFHIGGASATEALLDPLGIAPGTRLLDVGSGIGGPARLAASRYGARVTGIDLTPHFVETARRLSALVGIEATFVEGSAVDLPFDDHSFDMATLLHVGMNVADKGRLFSEVARVLVPGGVFAVYDVMLFGTHPAFPLPWASRPEQSALVRPQEYLDAAARAGMALVSRVDRGAVARAFFEQVQRIMAESGPPAAGLPLLMGADAGEKVAHMVAAVNAGDIQPVEMVFRTARDGEGEA